MDKNKCQYLSHGYFTYYLQTMYPLALKLTETEIRESFDVMKIINKHMHKYCQQTHADELLKQSKDIEFITEYMDVMLYLKNISSKINRTH